MPIRCEVVSQDRIVFQGNAELVSLPGANGEMGILSNHSPLLTVLKFGMVKVRTAEEILYFTVAGGVAEVQPDQVTILADAAENVEEIDTQRAEAALRRAEELLEMKSDEMDLETYLAVQTSLRKSNLRLEAVRRFRRSKTPQRE